MMLKLGRIAVVSAAALTLAAASIPTKAQAFGFLAPAIIASAIIGAGSGAWGGARACCDYGGGGYAYGGYGCCVQVPPPPPCCYYGGGWGGGRGYYGGGYGGYYGY